MTQLLQQYREQVKPALKTQFGYPNPMMIPVLRKVVVSMGLAEAGKDKGNFREALAELSLITGQRPLVTHARQSVSNFKLRQGQEIGAKVTLRGKRMYDFVYRFCNIVAPRIRDFRGLSRKCDGRGNYSLGLEDQQIFPEINLDKVKRTQGMNITFVTSAQSDEECVALLAGLGLPFKEIEQKEKKK